MGCAAQATGSNAVRAAAGVAAGVALAAAGAALASESSADSAKPKSRPHPPPESGRWRLVREPDPNDSVEKPAYYIEE
jgi:hypothetical protein